MSKLQVIKRDGTLVDFDATRVKNAIQSAVYATGQFMPVPLIESFANNLASELCKDCEQISVDSIQNYVENWLMTQNSEVAKAYILYRSKHDSIREYTQHKMAFIQRYKKSNNTANATIDDNSNVANKNIGVLNSEIHKEDNLQISRAMVMQKLMELYPDFDAKQYQRDLQSHIIYKHDENSFAGAIAPYCCSITMYPFLTNGIKGIGGLSAAPKNIDSFCGMYVNLIFATSAMFAGAVATSEFLLYFTYFAKKEWGEDFWKNPDKVITKNSNKEKTIKKQIHQYWQQVIYSINQPAAARGSQSAFVNFSYFDKYFFEGMFGEFMFPDGTKPDWDSLNWIQREFMQWFNQERLRCILTFPVESFALVYQNGEFLDKSSAEFVAQEYARGHSFFTYISDTVDSLSSCCRLKNMITTKEFNFTNGNMGVQTGSKSVITSNLSRIIQDFFRQFTTDRDTVKAMYFADKPGIQSQLTEYINSILERVFKYHIAYNELLWDMYTAKLLPVYSSGFINLNNQYLTLGINGLNQAAEFIGIECNKNSEYKEFCNLIFSIFKNFNTAHNGKYFGHKVTLNTECVPAEGLAIKNYNWDKAEGYWVPKDTNLYASYIFKPNDTNISVLDKMIMHGIEFSAGSLDGGQAAHINLDKHLSVEQYRKLLDFAGKVGCSYFTFNIPNCECEDCGFIAKQPFTECPRCGGTNTALWDRVIGYLTKVRNWSEGRQIEQKTRFYADESALQS